MNIVYHDQNYMEILIIARQNEVKPRGLWDKENIILLLEASLTISWSYCNWLSIHKLSIDILIIHNSYLLFINRIYYLNLVHYELIEQIKSTKSILKLFSLTMSSTPVTYATTFRISELFWDKLHIKPVMGLNILPNVHAFMALKDWKSYLLSSTTLLELHKTIYTLLLIQTVTSIMISILLNSKMFFLHRTLKW